MNWNFALLICRIDDAVKDREGRLCLLCLAWFGKIGLLGFVLHICILYELELWLLIRRIDDALKDGGREEGDFSN